MGSPETPDVPTRVAMLEHRADASERGLENLRRDMNQAFSDLRGELLAEIGELRREFNARFGEIIGEIDGRFGEVNARLDRHLRWVITTALAVVGANVGILTLLLRGR